MTRHEPGAGDAPITQIRLEDGGLFAVRSISATVYYLDLDARLLLRQPGEDSPTGPYDGCWVALTSIQAVDEELGQASGNTWDPVRVGRRHVYHLDPHPGRSGSPYRWWLQRAVTAIDAVPAKARPVGRRPGDHEDWVPYL